MRCPKCGAGLTKWGDGWLCTFCHIEYADAEIKHTTLDKFGGGD